MSKKTKICHVTSVHRRYDTRIFHKECASLANAGYDVTLVVRDKLPCEIIKGVKICSFAFETKNRMERIFKIPLKIVRFALEVDADIYHLHDPELLLAVPLLRKNNKKIIFDSHEDIPAQICNKEWIPRGFRLLMSYFFYFFEKITFKYINYIIGVSPSQIDKLKSITSNVVMITNYPVILPKNYEHVCANRNYSSFIFAGGISKQWNHFAVLSALENIEASYRLMGITDDSYLEELKACKTWEKVCFLGVVSHEQVIVEMESCMAGLALLQYSPNTEGKVGTLGNTKLFEYMRAGLPIICTDFILWKDIVDKWQCGICVSPDDVRSVEEAMHFLLLNPETAREMGENSRHAFLQEYNWTLEEKKLLQLYAVLR